MVLKLPFAGLVRSRMRERGVGLRELCRAVDVDPSYFSKVLADKRNPPSEDQKHKDRCAQQPCAAAPLAIESVLDFTEVEIPTTGDDLVALSLDLQTPVAQPRCCRAP